jgi:hypothetical protein
MEEIMYGIVFHEMKKYIVTNLGDKAWDSLFAGSGLEEEQVSSEPDKSPL